MNANRQPHLDLRPAWSRRALVLGGCLVAFVAWGSSDPARADAPAGGAGETASDLVAVTQSEVVTGIRPEAWVGAQDPVDEVASDAGEVVGDAGGDAHDAVARAAARARAIVEEVAGPPPPVDDAEPPPLPPRDETEPRLRQPHTRDAAPLRSPVRQRPSPLDRGRGAIQEKAAPHTPSRGIAPGPRHAMPSAVERWAPPPPEGSGAPIPESSAPWRHVGGPQSDDQLVAVLLLWSATASLAAVGCVNALRANALLRPQEISGPGG